MKEDLEKSFAFILEVEKLKAVQRRTKPLGLNRYENSAEHSWQIALLALTLKRFADEEINVEKVIKMLLLHDIGEIDADDVFFFDDAGRENAKEKELANSKTELRRKRSSPARSTASCRFCRIFITTSKAGRKTT